MMYDRMKKHITLIMCVVCLCCSGCGKTEGITGIASDNDSQAFWNDAPFAFARGENGYYYISERYDVRNVMFFDAVTKESYPVCGKAECTHDNENCDAYLGDDYNHQSIWYYRGHLYLMRYDERQADLILVEFNQDCTQRKELFVVARNSDRSEGRYGLVFHDEDVYIYDILGTATFESDNHISINKMALDGSKKEEIFVKEMDAVEFSAISAVKSYGDFLMFTVVTREVVEDTVQSEMSGIYAYDYQSGEISTFLDEPICDYTIDEKNQILYYYKFGDGLYKKDLQSQQTERIYQCEENNKFCQISYDGKYIYINNQRMETIWLFVPIYTWVIDSNGTIMQKIEMSHTFFGDDQYIFGRDHDGKLIAISKENVGEWTSDDYIYLMFGSFN